MKEILAQGWPVRRSADPAGGKVDLAGIGFGISDEFRDVFGGQVEDGDFNAPPSSSQPSARSATSLP